MTNFQRLWKNGTVWNTIGTGAFASTSFVMLLVVGRTLGIASVGSFGIALTTAQLLYRIAIFSVREIQITDQGDQFPFAAYFTAKILTTSLAICLSIFYLLFRRSFVDIGITFLLTLYYLILSYDDLFQNELFKRNRLDLSGKSKVLVIISSLLAFSILLFNMRVLIIPLTAAIIIGMLSSYFFCVRLLDIPSYHWNYCEAWSILKQSAPVFISSFFLTVMNSIPRYCISYFCDVTTSGYANSIFALSTLAELGSNCIYIPFIPQLSKKLTSNCKFEAYRLLFKLLCSTLLIIIFITLAVAWFGIPVMGLLYKEDFSMFKSELLLVIGGCGGLMALISLFYWIPIILREKNYIMLLYGIGMLTTAISCPPLTKAFGISGAALGLMIGSVIILSLSAFHLIKLVVYVN